MISIVDNLVEVLPPNDYHRMNVTDGELSLLLTQQYSYPPRYSIAYDIFVLKYTYVHHIHIIKIQLLFVRNLLTNSTSVWKNILRRYGSQPTYHARRLLIFIVDINFY